VNLASALLVGLTKTLVGAYPSWEGSQPSPAQRIYFANHTSHIDTLAVWSALPARLRANTRPVAAKDYWDRGSIRRLVTRSLNAVLVERAKEGGMRNRLAPLAESLRNGDSLIFFPEGTRGPDSIPGPFKSGLFHLMQAFPTVELIPVYLENVRRAMPKGTFMPIPLICTVRFGAALHRVPDERKETFLERARNAVVALL
jgi:1-acyl-sn-glycerol-3-phosphate acyltransferase